MLFHLSWPQQYHPGLYGWTIKFHSISGIVGDAEYTLYLQRLIVAPRSIDDDFGILEGEFVDIGRAERKEEIGGDFP